MIIEFLQQEALECGISSLKSSRHLVFKVASLRTPESFVSGVPFLQSPELLHPQLAVEFTFIQRRRSL